MDLHLKDTFFRTFAPISGPFGGTHRDSSIVYLSRTFFSARSRPNLALLGVPCESKKFKTRFASLRSNKKSHFFRQNLMFQKLCQNERCKKKFLVKIKIHELLSYLPANDLQTCGSLRLFPNGSSGRWFSRL